MRLPGQAGASICALVYDERGGLWLRVATTAGFLYSYRVLLGPSTIEAVLEDQVNLISAVKKY